MKNEITRSVKAKRYGNEGLTPADKHSCPYRGAASCVSASGGSYCGGYGGDAPVSYTHLDVYKRQGLMNCRTLLRPW